MALRVVLFLGPGDKRREDKQGCHPDGRQCRYPSSKYGYPVIPLAVVSDILPSIDKPAHNVAKHECELAKDEEPVPSRSETIGIFTERFMSLLGVVNNHLIETEAVEPAVVPWYFCVLGLIGFLLVCSLD